MKILTQSEDSGPIADDLIQKSPYYEQVFLWLRSMFSEEDEPKLKVLPLLLCATMREEVNYVARMLNDNLFLPSENGQYGLAKDGKRYLIIIPI